MTWVSAKPFRRSRSCSSSNAKLPTPGKVSAHPPGCPGLAAGQLEKRDCALRPDFRLFFCASFRNATADAQSRGRRSDRAFAGKDLVVTTYGLLARLPWLRQLHWRLVVLDEAQAIKNPGARADGCVKELRAPARIALTGTPVENRLGRSLVALRFHLPRIARQRR